MCYNHTCGGDIAAVEHGASHISGPHGSIQTHGESAAVEEVGEHVSFYFSVRVVANEISVVALPCLIGRLER